MGKLVADLFMTMDGVIQSPGGPDEDTSGGFKYGGWQFARRDVEAGAIITANILKMDALMLGRKTYENFAAYWPKAPPDFPIAKHLNAVPKLVASKTLSSVDWNNSSLIKNPLKDEVTKLKEKFKEIHIIGSGNLMQTLMENDLVDEFTLWIFPITIGSGERLFEKGTMPRNYDLIETKSVSSGAVLCRYRLKGELTL